MMSVNKATETARRIANKFVTKSVFDMDNNELKEERIKAINSANICVEEIISTLGNSDFDKVKVNDEAVFWVGVKAHLDKMYNEYSITN